jgi:hypothetical protein
MTVDLASSGIAFICDPGGITVEAINHDRQDKPTFGRRER